MESADCDLPIVFLNRTPLLGAWDFWIHAAFVVSLKRVWWMDVRCWCFVCVHFLDWAGYGIEGQLNSSSHICDDVTSVMNNDGKLLPLDEVRVGLEGKRSQRFSTCPSRCSPFRAHSGILDKSMSYFLPCPPSHARYTALHRQNIAKTERWGVRVKRHVNISTKHNLACAMWHS